MNDYCQEVLEPVLNFPAISECQLWTKRLYSDVAIMFVEGLSGFLAAHILVIDEHIAEKIQEHKVQQLFQLQAKPA